MSSSFSTGSIASKPRQEQNKRRRVSTMESSQAKRSRRRVAGINVQPLNDEDLLRRLKENHEEHKRRWAQGSFLRSIRIRVRSSSPKGRPHIQWRTWLSLNPENDGTAIWLEHKFDVPSSGSWDSETVFSIPAIPDPKGVRSRGSPGLIVFERTPLEDLPDEIERKYRILDDCSRLRDIIDSLPQDEDLRFIPSLLVIDWVDSSEGSQAAVDFVTMTEKLVSDGIIKGVSTLTVSTKMSDPDGKMVDILNSMPLDVEDRFVVSISWEDLTNRFLLLFKEAVSEWLDSCWNGDKLDRSRLLEFSETVKGAGSAMVCKILNLIENGSKVVLETPAVDAASPLSKRALVDRFLEKYPSLLLGCLEQVIGGQPSTEIMLLRAQIEAAVHDFEYILQEKGNGLQYNWMMAAQDVRPSPKRRAAEDDLSESIPASHSNKRMRSSSLASTDGEAFHSNNGTAASPPPSSAASTSGTTDVLERPLVTVAMLRSLTRDVLKTYGRSHKQ